MGGAEQASTLKRNRVKVERKQGLPPASFLGREIHARERPRGCKREIRKQGASRWNFRKGVLVAGNSAQGNGANETQAKRGRTVDSPSGREGSKLRSRSTEESFKIRGKPCRSVLTHDLTREAIAA